ncbi:MAG: hypothetical protein MI919_14660, partial [Holophagales bacterium]|nr:hypothetical protein [Holophagales bacterium]
MRVEPIQWKCVGGLALLVLPSWTAADPAPFPPMVLLEYNSADRVPPRVEETRVGRDLRDSAATKQEDSFSRTEPCRDGFPTWRYDEPGEDTVPVRGRSVDRVWEASEGDNETASPIHIAEDQSCL